VLCEQSEVSRHYRHHIPAPPKPAPSHAESYNPPPEYLFTKEEVLCYSFLVHAVEIHLSMTEFQTLMAQLFKSPDFC